MDQTLFNRQYPTQRWTTTFDSPEIRRATNGLSRPHRLRIDPMIRSRCQRIGRTR